MTADRVRLTVAMMSATALGRADLHVHPAGNRTSGGSSSVFLAVLLAARLDVVGLTDHNRIDVAVELAARGADAGRALVIGEEITTREGHLIGLGLRALVAPGGSLGDTVAEIHAQGGIAIVAHPLLPMLGSASPRVIEALAQGRPDRRPDALEAFNPRAAWLPGYRRRVEKLAAGAGYAIVGGSDAHQPVTVGRGVTRFRGRTFADLAAAIATRETVAQGRAYGFRDLLPAARHRAGTEGRG